LLKLLSMAALLAGVLMLADHRVSAQGGKPASGDAGSKDAGEKEGDDQPPPAAGGEDDKGAKQGTEAEEPEEPATEEEEPAAIVDTGGYLKLTADVSKKNEEAQVRHILQKGTFEGTEQAEFDDYFQSYFFRSWADPSFISKVTEQRAKLRNLFDQCRGAQIHDHLLALSLRFLKILAQKNFHPASRYNGMLAIGELNDSEHSGANLAVPHAGALPVLLETLKSGPSDALRVAALRGLLRHCQSGIANTQTRDTEVIPALLELAKSGPPQRRSPEGHAWMRTLAIESLAALHAPGAVSVAAVGQNGVIDAMAKIAADRANPPSVRCAAARALGSIGPGPKPARTPAQLAALLRQLTADFCDAELTRQKQSPDTPVFRREVRQRLNDVKKALDTYPGLGEAASDLSAEVRSLIGKLDVKDASDEAMTKDIEESLRNLRGALSASR
jgi:hypothetical protein